MSSYLFRLFLPVSDRSAFHLVSGELPRMVEFLQFCRGRCSKGNDSLHVLSPRSIGQGSVTRTPEAFFLAVKLTNSNSTSREVQNLATDHKSYKV